MVFFRCSPQKKRELKLCFKHISYSMNNKTSTHSISAIGLAYFMVAEFITLFLISMPHFPYHFVVFNGFFVFILFTCGRMFVVIHNFMRQMFINKWMQMLRRIQSHFSPSLCTLSMQFNASWQHTNNWNSRGKYAMIFFFRLSSRWIAKKRAQNTHQEDKSLHKIQQPYERRDRSFVTHNLHCIIQCAVPYSFFVVVVAVDIHVMLFFLFTVHSCVYDL